MSKKNENFVSSTDSAIRIAGAGKSRADWAAAACEPVPDGSDPDDAMEPVDWATTSLLMPTRKAHMNLRIDADIVAFFRQQGKGYQTKINAVLRSYVDQMSRHEPR